MKYKAIKGRVFNVVQFEVNPKTGESLNFSEANIKACVAHKSITSYAYIRHDKDVYTTDDEKNGHKAGTPKPPHYHIIIKCDNAIELGTIAKWLGIPPQYVEIPKGRGAFLDCVQYLTHESEKEQVLGKYLYSDSEITANFDFRAELNKREDNKIKYGVDLGEKNQMRYDVLYLGKRLYDCRKSNPILYLDDCMILEKLRHRYLTEVAQIPPLRINFYIDGDGGIGKNTASKVLAKSLFPDMEKPYFEVGASGVTF